MACANYKTIIVGCRLPTGMRFDSSLVTNGREMVRNSEMNFRMSLLFNVGSIPATSTSYK